MKKAIQFLTELKKSRDFDGNLENKLNEALKELCETKNTLIMLRKSLGSPFGINSEEYKEYWSEDLNDILK